MFAPSWVWLSWLMWHSLVGGIWLTGWLAACGVRCWWRGDLGTGDMVMGLLGDGLGDGDEVRAECGWLCVVCLGPPGPPCVGLLVAHRDSRNGELEAWALGSGDGVSVGPSTVRASQRTRSPAVCNSRALCVGESCQASLVFEPLLGSYVILVGVVGLPWVAWLCTSSEL